MEKKIVVTPPASFPNSIKASNSSGSQTMRIATLQFNPQVGAVEENIRNADDLLAKGGLLGKGKGKVDLLVLPEMAFSGELKFPIS